jgi:hypothetical protein
MKKLFLLLALPMIGFGQNVNIPDANFKAALVGNIAINTNGDNEIQVSEASVFNGTINVYSLNIFSLSGIEAFVSLTVLFCQNNPFTNLDVSGCTALNSLSCQNSQLTSLDVSGCTALTTLYCPYNLITSLDVSGCTALTDLSCYYNELTSLDVSTCTALTYLVCSNNNLTSLNVKNGNNINMDLYAKTNPNLSCIEVDNVAWSNANWPNTIDATASFSLNCSGAGISDINESNTLMLYPNPAVSELNILGEGAFSYEISDMSGKIFFQGEVNESDKIRIAELNAGVYNITHITENKIQTLRFIKQ